MAGLAGALERVNQQTAGFPCWVCQATDLREVLEIFDSEGVDGAFVFMFALENLPHRPDGDPRLDLDMASPGIVKVLEGRHGDTYPNMEWEPKAAFTTVAECYGG